MDWHLVFRLANLFAFACWIVLIFAPRREIVFTGLGEIAVGLMCLLYASVLVAMMIAPPSEAQGADFSSIEGVRMLFASDPGVTLGWVHYLAFDLFVGLWVARTSDEIGLSRVVQAPILVATFIFGPAGMLIFLIVRRIHTARKTA